MGFMLAIATTPRSTRSRVYNHIYTMHTHKVHSNSHYMAAVPWCVMVMMPWLLESLKRLWRVAITFRPSLPKPNPNFPPPIHTETNTHHGHLRGVRGSAGGYAV